MNKKRLLGIVDYLIKSYKAGSSTLEIVENLPISNKEIVKAELANRNSLSSALKKANILPSHVVYLLEAGEKSGKVPEILQSYQKILENQIKIEAQIQGYKNYLMFISFVFLFGIIIFYFIFNNVMLPLLEDSPTKQGSLIGIIRIVKDLLNSLTVVFVFLLVILFNMLLSFRNLVLDMFEYYILGKPYRNLAFSQIMTVWGNLISSGISIPLSLYVSVSTLENSLIKEKINSIFSTLTNNYTQISNEIIKEIVLLFPEGNFLVGSITKGTLDQDLISLSERVVEESTKDLEKRIRAIMSILVTLSLVIVGALIVISFLSIYAPLIEQLTGS
ncbi:MAG: type II secretion system F family protein [bacterium]